MCPTRSSRLSTTSSASRSICSSPPARCSPTTLIFTSSSPSAPPPISSPPPRSSPSSCATHSRRPRPRRPQPPRPQPSRLWRSARLPSLPRRRRRRRSASPNRPSAPPRHRRRRPSATPPRRRGAGTYQRPADAEERPQLSTAAHCDDGSRGARAHDRTVVEGSSVGASGGCGTLGVGGRHVPDVARCCIGLWGKAEWSGTLARARGA
mmetsp:Transcript_14915/g.39318  ORF Transcript_14915/g.39318 Transcript_14915/m.39318 type:complete len:208 (-) Transcript_14915:161-784(-)